MEEKPPRPTAAITRRKRNRLRKSCHPCRLRKSKCDGTRPSCLTCLSRGQPSLCTYEQLQTGQSKRTSIRNIPSLPSERNNSLGNLPTGTPGGTLIGSVPDLTPHASSKSWSPESGHRENESTAPGENPQSIKKPIRQCESIFGPPSTHSFIRRVAATIEPINKRTAPPSNFLGKPYLNDPIGFTVSNTNDISMDIDSLLLPEKKLADSLMNTYWRFSHPIFPVLHWPSFTDKYDNLWRSTDSFSLSKYTGNDMLLLSIVNVVLAIGCQRSEHCPAEWRTRDAESLYRRSVRLVSAETLDEYSFPAAQLFILRAIYLQYTSFASRCWSTLGVAQRVAYGLGLHKDIPESTNQLEREMRRRLWHTSLIMDSIASYTFGWPIAMGRTNSVPLPQAIDDEYLLEEGEGYQPAHKPSRLEFFRNYLQLSEVPREITDSMHALGQNSIEQGSTTSLTQYVSEMPKYCLQLDEMLGNLPSQLQEANQPVVEECFRVQSLVLSIRSTYVRLSILRPCLLATVANRTIRSELLKAKTGNTSLAMGLLNDVNKLCVSTARTVITRVHKNAYLMYQASTWHTLRVTFGSATVLLAASLLPELQVDLDQEPDRTIWEQTIAIFELYMSYDISAQGGLQALRDYQQRFEAAKKRDKPSKAELDCSNTPPISQGSTVVGLPAEISPGLDNEFLGSGASGPDGDLSQAFFDWNWLDFDIAEVMKP
ncbi:fungal-specific transcription factor domain-containing protein [Trichoderma austrokoningii]